MHGSFEVSAVVEEREAPVRIVILLAVICGCRAQPRPPLLFDRQGPTELALTHDIRVDLKALDTDRFRIALGGRTLIPEHLVRSRVAGATVVNGTIRGGGTLALARVGTRLTGIIRLGSAGFEIEPTATGHRLIPRSWRRPRPLHGPQWSEIMNSRGRRPPPKPTLEPVEITVLFAYTQAVLDQRTLDGIRGHIAIAMAQVDHAVSAGKVRARFVAIETPVRTTGRESDRSIEEIYYDLLHHKDFLDAHADRRTNHADILFLLVDQQNGGLGVGTIMADATTSVAVADHHDSLWSLTIPHEIAHLMGAIHEDDDSDSPFEWGHGYVGSEGRTIETNPCSDDSCVLLEEWSSRLGHGDPQKCDVVRVLGETSPTVATFGEGL